MSIELISVGIAASAVSNALFDIIKDAWNRKLERDAETKINESAIKIVKDYIETSPDNVTIEKSDEIMQILKKIITSPSSTHKKPEKTPHLEVVKNQKTERKDDGVDKEEILSKVEFSIGKHCDFGNFVNSNLGFVNNIEKLKKLITLYANRTSVKRPLNIALVAKPGSGKSYLIEQLVDNLDDKLNAEMVSFNVAAAKTLDDLWTMFEKVKTISSENNRLPVVFLDEVDAQLGNGNIYQKLLAPMADGKYFCCDENRPKKIGKSIWITAASESWDPGEIYSQDVDFTSTTYEKWTQAKINRIIKEVSLSRHKLQDFKDRVDSWLIVPPVNVKFVDTKDFEGDLAAIVMVIIKKHFPNTKQIEISVVDSLASTLDSSGSLRLVEHIVFLSTCPDKGLFQYEHFDDNTKAKLEKVRQARIDVGYSENAVYQIEEWQETED